MPLSRRQLNQPERQMFDIQKSKTQITRVQIAEYKGKKRLDIRGFYLNADGEYAPTQKGATIPIDDIPEFLAKIGEMIK